MNKQVVTDILNFASATRGQVQAVVDATAVGRERLKRYTLGEFFPKLTALGELVTQYQTDPSGMTAEEQQAAERWLTSSHGGIAPAQLVNALYGLEMIIKFADGDSSAVVAQHITNLYAVLVTP